MGDIHSTTASNRAVRLAATAPFGVPPRLTFGDGD